ncbi:hypothetical protein [Fervidicoccus fontis]|jgi:hypothetical protein|uniref:Uncharacterized protein n=1 Tax=Fervidicoccus fontis TaxID=683846 RepID=A0A7C2VD64_9CREN|nr:hypothetical protein [Fervidicoccus fontis]HEW64468.1 hypothetical protein [Fervidicoccus fontis]
MLIEDWNPDKEVEIEEMVTKRLVKFSAFSRYYLGLREGNKPCDWVYFSNETLKLIEKLYPKHVNKDHVTRYAKRNNLILPKYMRKVSWRLMIKAMSREVSRFILRLVDEIIKEEVGPISEAEVYKVYFNNKEVELLIDYIVKCSIGDISVKIIYSNNPSMTLIHYYEYEKHMQG